jgi:hypothetical protein
MDGEKRQNLRPDSDHDSRERYIDGYFEYIIEVGKKIKILTYKNNLPHGGKS